MTPKAPASEAPTVTDKFMTDSARAAIRALRNLEPTAIMLEKWAPEVFPEVNAQGQKHFGRIMMEAAAATIRQSWANAIKETTNAKLAEDVAREEVLIVALRDITALGEENRDLRDAMSLANDALKKLGVADEVPV